MISIIIMNINYTKLKFYDLITLQKLVSSYIVRILWLLIKAIATR